MSPRFYGFLWILYAIAAGIVWLFAMFTMFSGVVFGFIAFGLVFVGMMCVLPSSVSHSPATKFDKSLFSSESGQETRQFDRGTKKTRSAFELRSH